MDRRDLRFHQIEILGLTRFLPIVKVAPGITIPSFVILGDVELINRAAPEIVKRLPEVDVIVGAEAKSIPLVHEVARLLNMNYVVARKSIKPYMVDPLTEEVFSITTQARQLLVLNGLDADKLAGKRVALVDDVISTGASIGALERLVAKAGGNVVAKAAIMAQGDAIGRTDIIYLQEHMIWRE